MADNITVSDANDVDRVLRATDTASVYTPHSIVDSSALPSGAATAANQATGNTSLATIAGDTTSLDGKVTACNTGAVVLAAGTAEIGKLAAGSAAIGTVVLGAGTAEVGKLAAGTAAIGSVILGAGTAEVGKLAAGTASIGTVVLGAGSASVGVLGANSGVDIGDVDVTSVSIPAAIYHGKTTVSSAGTEVTLASSQAITSGVTIKALSDNTGLIYVGANPVTSSTGFELNAKESVFLEVANLTTVYIDSAVNGEGVTYLAS